MLHNRCEWHPIGSICEPSGKIAGNGSRSIQQLTSGQACRPGHGRDTAGEAIVILSVLVGILAWDGADTHTAVVVGEGMLLASRMKRFLQWSWMLHRLQRCRACAVWRCASAGGGMLAVAGLPCRHDAHSTPVQRLVMDAGGLIMPDGWWKIGRRVRSWSSGKGI